MTQKITKLRTDPTKIVAEFERFAPRYDDEISAGKNIQGRAFSYFAPERLMQVFSDVVALEEIDTCLDVGTGTGILAQKIKSENEDVVITGVDISPDMLAIAQEKNILHDIKVTNVEEGMPFRDNSFDAVVTCGVFEFINDDTALVQEMARVTAPQGYMALAAVKSEKLDNLQLEGFTRLAYVEDVGYKIDTAAGAQQADYIYAVFQKHTP